MDSNFLKSLSEFRQRVSLWRLALLSFAVLIVFIFVFAILPPRSFPKDTPITIESGSLLKDVGVSLKDRGYIRSSFLFSEYFILLRSETGVKAGTYFFDRPFSLFGIAKRLKRGEYGIDDIRLTIPEGSSIAEIAEIAVKKIPNFNKEEFLKYSPAEEGYLFPDTYHLSPLSSAKTLRDFMRTNFDLKIKSISSDISNSKLNLADIVILASIVEEEARQTETRRIVAGILLRRLREGMPLQVDATFRYINGKTTADLTLEDLNIDSPYNTYKYGGLPPTPITNPGLDSIIATLNPIETSYYYFLTDDEGEMHYAESFDEHVANKRRYLR